jgi:hypothetical protein
MTEDAVGGTPTAAVETTALPKKSPTTGASQIPESLPAATPMIE